MHRAHLLGRCRPCCSFVCSSCSACTCLYLPSKAGEGACLACAAVCQLADPVNALSQSTAARKLDADLPWALCFLLGVALVPGFPPSTNQRHAAALQNGGDCCGVFVCRGSCSCDVWLLLQWASCSHCHLGRRWLGACLGASSCAGGLAQLGVDRLTTRCLRRIALVTALLGGAPCWAVGWAV